MNLTARPFRSDGDLLLINDPIQVAAPLSLHAVDFPWRLSSPALQSELGARLWLTADGDEALGFRPAYVIRHKGQRFS